MTLIPEFLHTLLFFLPFLLVYTVFAVYAERKISAFIQDRMGPMEVGYKGLLQTVADLMKLLQKEDIVPAAADRKLFLIAPIIIFTSIFGAYALIPLNVNMAGSALAHGLFYLLGIVSLDVIGLLLAGWGSNSKYSLYGAMRSVAQIISYEVPLGLSILCVVIFTGSLNLQEISFQQSIWPSVLESHSWVQGTARQDSPIYFLGLPFLGWDVASLGGFFTWNVFQMPLLFLAWVLFFITSLAESNRAPFDLPEAESEIIGGFHTEYSGFRWAMIMLSEYGMMMLVSLLGAILFFGSWNSPFPNLGTLKLAEWTGGLPGHWSGTVLGTFWLLSKAILLVLIQMWVRWTYPRLRVDQLMDLCWKYLVPFSLILMFLIAWWKLYLV